MRELPEQEASHGDLDHGFGYVDTLLIVARQAPPSHHPSEGSLDDPSSGKDFDSLLAFHLSEDFDDEVEEGNLVHQLAPVVGAVCEEVLQPRPGFADRILDHLRARRVRDVRRRQVDHAQATVALCGGLAMASSRNGSL